MKNKINQPDFSEELKLWKQSFNFVVGLDEVGRGPLAGPVCAAAVCLAAAKQTAAAKLKIKNEKLKIFGGLKDSKKLTAKQRERWYEILTTHPDIKWGVGMVSAKVIDRINILGATKLAMKKALENLEVAAEYLLIDGNFLLEDLSISQKAVVRGDSKIVSCAAASIIAKVTRDRLLVKYHQQYPPYGFDRHKGYGTRRHIAAIKKHGACFIHRQSFAPFKNRI